MKFKDLPKMESDNILHDRAFKFVNKPKYVGYQCRLA